MLSTLTQHGIRLFYNIFRPKNLLLLAFSTSITNIALADNPFSSTTTLSKSVSLTTNQADEPNYLAVDEAFTIDVHPNDDGYDLVWTIAPDYYLYKRQFQILQPSQTIATTPEKSTADITSKARFSKGLKKNDDYFGRVEVFYNQALAVIDSNALLPGQPKTLTVKYQGCAEAGLCYPIQTKTVVLPEQKISENQ